MSKSQQEVERRPWLPLVAIAGALVVWGLLLALGAYFAPVGEQAGHDRRKLWVVAATTGGFLMLWAAALVLRRSRPKRSRQLSDYEKETPDDRDRR